MKKVTYSALALLSLSATLLVVSCKKKSDDASPATPKGAAAIKTLLTAHTWKLTKKVFNGADSTSTIDACDKDNVYTYNADSTYAVDAGATKCTGEGQTVERGRFRLLANNTKLVTISDSAGVDPDTATLSALTTDQLILTESFDGDVVSLTFGK